MKNFESKKKLKINDFRSFLSEHLEPLFRTSTMLCFANHFVTLYRQASPLYIEIDSLNPLRSADSCPYLSLLPLLFLPCSLSSYDMADLSEYPSTPSFTPTPRFLSLVSSFRSLHLSDPTASSLTYHTTLEAYSRQLCQLSLALFPSAPQILHQGPSEALLISSNAQHVQRWLYPRNTYPDGLAGYKRWRTNLNRFHATVAREEMKKCGYSEERDKELFDRVEVLLTKKTLARPPLPQKLEELKGESFAIFSMSSEN